MCRSDRELFPARLGPSSTPRGDPWRMLWARPVDDRLRSDRRLQSLCMVDGNVARPLAGPVAELAVAGHVEHTHAFAVAVERAPPGPSEPADFTGVRLL